MLKALLFATLALGVASCSGTSSSADAQPQPDLADSEPPPLDSATPHDAPGDGPGHTELGLVPDSGADGPPGATFRVATFNCHCLIDDPATRARGIAAEIDALKLHAVGLQEVCQSLGSGGSDNFAQTLALELQALTGQAWEQRFAKTHVSWSAYDEGLAVLVPKGQVLDWGEQALPQGQGPFPRKVIWARVGTAGGPFYLYSTHLTISSDPLDREAQAKAILALASQAGGAPRIVVGDFNDGYGSAAVSAMKGGPPAFTESWGAKHPGSTSPGLTCCYPSFGSRIDYIFVESSALTSLDQVELAFDQPYQGLPLSDHRGLWVQVTY